MANVKNLDMLYKQQFGENEFNIFKDLHLKYSDKQYYVIYLEACIKRKLKPFTFLQKKEYEKITNKTIKAKSVLIHTIAEKFGKQELLMLLNFSNEYYEKYRNLYYSLTHNENFKPSVWIEKEKAKVDNIRFKDIRIILTHIFESNAKECFEYYSKMSNFYKKRYRGYIKKALKSDYYKESAKTPQEWHERLLKTDKGYKSEDTEAIVDKFLNLLRERIDKNSAREYLAAIDRLNYGGYTW